jgi:hypothetical protein
MANKYQKWEYLLREEHDRHPAPFNPDYNQKAVDDYEKFKKEKSAYAKTIDNDSVSDNDFDIAMQIKEDELVLKHKIEFLMTPALFVKSTGYATFLGPVEYSKAEPRELSFVNRMVHALKETKQEYAVPKRIRQFMALKDFSDDQIILSGEAMVVLSEDKKSGCVYYTGRDIQQQLDEAQSLIDNTLGRATPLFDTIKAEEAETHEMFLKH